MELDLPMPVRLMEAHPKAEAQRNQVAVMRGPVLYCLESPDLPETIDVSDVYLEASRAMEACRGERFTFWHPGADRQGIVPPRTTLDRTTVVPPAKPCGLHTPAGAIDPLFCLGQSRALGHDRLAADSLYCLIRQTMTYELSKRRNRVASDAKLSQVNPSVA